jgi:hypothetical protein
MEELLYGAVYRCTIGSGSVDGPEAGKGQTDNKVKKSADLYHEILSLWLIVPGFGHLTDTIIEGRIPHRMSQVATHIVFSKGCEKGW